MTDLDSDGDADWFAEGEENRVVSAYLAIRTLRGAATAAQIIALLGVGVWIAVTILEWYQTGDFRTPGTERATAVLAPVSILILSALLGLVGFACRAGSDWLSLRLDSDHLGDEGDIDDDPSSSLNRTRGLSAPGLTNARRRDRSSR